MKYIRKLLNPLNPILPAFLLLIAFLWFGYSDFVKEKYTENEKMIFKEGIKFTDELSESYRKEFKKHESDFYDEDYLPEFALQKSYLELYETDRKLDNLTRNVIENNFDKIDFSKKADISIISIFEKYIKEAKNINLLLRKRYENFDLEDGLNNSQLNQLYFSRDSLESKYHLARFKTQLIKMRADDIKFIRQETITNKVKTILSNYTIQPHIAEGKNNYSTPDSKNILFLTLFVPFDTANTRIVVPKNVETRFDEKGFLIIPLSLRDNNEELVIEVISEIHTTLYKR